MIIRAATPDDAEAIAQVHISSWRTTYPGIVPQAHLDGLDISRLASTLQKRLTDEEDASSYLVAVSDQGDVIGFASIGPNRDPELDYQSEIYAIYLLNEYQRVGIGSALFRESIHTLLDQGYRSMLLWVLAENPARGFYEHFGGSVISTKEITLGGKVLNEVCYGWHNMAAI